MKATPAQRTLLALIPLGILVGLLALDIAIFGADSILGASQVVLLVASGICVWLVLSELMPARIRANGMAIALFANQFVAWGLASSFFPMVNAWGYGPVFFGFAGSGILYFLTVLFIPETKGLPLERIEHLFDRKA